MSKNIVRTYRDGNGRYFAVSFQLAEEHDTAFENWLLLCAQRARESGGKRKVNGGLLLVKVEEKI